PERSNGQDTRNAGTHEARRARPRADRGRRVRVGPRAARRDAMRARPISHHSLNRTCFATPMTWIKRAFTGGSAGNEQLTAVVATVLVVLLAIEGATLLQLTSLLTVHAFVGMLLIPVVALKLASTGWRMLRYYRRGEEYVRRGPPHVVLRMPVAPVVG